MPVAFVSGAAQGLGQAIALRLAEDGFDVAINDIASKDIAAVVDAVKTRGRNAIAVPADVSSWVEVEAAVQETVKQLGSLDCMVANAGIYYPCPFSELTPDIFTTLVNVNLMGVYNCFKAASTVMLAEGHGGRLIGLAEHAGYAATKFAVRGLVQSIAREYGKRGITVNCYCPGAIDTPMLQDPATGELVDAAKQWAATTPSIPRIGKPEDVANVVSFLASEKSGYITGQSLVVDGGDYCT